MLKDVFPAFQRGKLPEIDGKTMCLFSGMHLKYLLQVILNIFGKGSFLRGAVWTEGTHSEGDRDRISI